MSQSSFGREGEEKAAEFLEKKGYEILDRNFRIRGGELDLIALNKDILVFVEVKSRTNFEFGTPLESISRKKLHDLIRAAEVYRKFHPNLPVMFRIDAIEVIKTSGDVVINHVENITM